MSLSAAPCPHLWTPDCECPLGQFHRPACPWFNPGLDPADYGPTCPGPECPMCNGEVCNLCGAGLRTRHGEPRCEHDVIERHREYDPGPTALDCPPEHGCLADEYDWLVPDGPEDPDRSWAHRDSGQ